MHVFFQSVINNLWTFFCRGWENRTECHVFIKCLIPETAMSRERKMEETIMFDQAEMTFLHRLTLAA